MSAGPTMHDYQLRPVGRVRAPWASCAEVPVQGGPAEIVVAPEFSAALDGVERGTHLIVLGWLHQADRTVLRARPRKVAPTAPPCGVFACRAPVRPNPISHTVVELVRRDGCVLHVDPLDLADGTPVVDIKAYSPGWDTVFAAQREQRVPTATLTDEQLQSLLQRDVRNHVGPQWTSEPVRAAIQAVQRAVRHFGVNPRDAALSVTVGRLDVATDALMAMLGATFGHGRVAFDATLGPERALFRLGAQSAELRLDVPE